MNTEAGDEARTRDPQLGKLMLYQLSYARAVVILAVRGTGSWWFRLDPQRRNDWSGMAPSSGPAGIPFAIRPSVRNGGAGWRAGGVTG